MIGIVVPTMILFLGEEKVAVGSDTIIQILSLISCEVIALAVSTAEIVGEVLSRIS